MGGSTREVKGVNGAPEMSHPLLPSPHKVRLQNLPQAGPCAPLHCSFASFLVALKPTLGYGPLFTRLSPPLTGL